MKIQAFLAKLSNKEVFLNKFIINIFNQTKNVNELIVLTRICNI